MELGLLIIRLLLAAVFGVAGLAKLYDFSGSKKAVADFGVPKSLAPVAAAILIAAELAVAVLLLFSTTAWFGAIGAAALLGVFVAGMFYQVLRGRAPDCHCFGQIKSEPVGVASIIRNLVFLVPAIVLVYRGQYDQGLSIAALDRGSIQTILLILLVLLSSAAVDYLRRIFKKQDELIRRLDLIDFSAAVDGKTVSRDDAGSPHDALPIGSFLPSFPLRSLDERAVGSVDLVAGKPVLLFFVSPTCEPCAALVPKIAERRAALSASADIYLISSGDASANIEKFGREHQILIDADRQFAKSVSAKWTPSALFVDERGRIASHVAAGDAAISELASIAIQRKEAASTAPIILKGERPVQHSVQVGEAVPEFAATTVKGEQVTKKNLLGKNTMLVFWGTECPHCIAMTEDLKEWESSKNGDSPELIVFSDDNPAANEALGFRAPVVLDPGRKLGEKLGMFGTPSAILVDERGHFASEIAVSAPQIWTLVGHDPSK